MRRARSLQMLLAVFDGHGQHGEYCSEYCAFECIELIESDPASLEKDPKEVMFKQARAATTRPRHRPPHATPARQAGDQQSVCTSPTTSPPPVGADRRGRLAAQEEA